MLSAVGRETERKFLVLDDRWRGEAASRQDLCQGYFATDGGNTVRVRKAGGRAWLTLKGPGAGPTRAEFEYEISPSDAEELFVLCRGRLVRKTRHRIPAGLRLWEVDEFAGENAGLIVAEIELPGEAAPFSRPPWLGLEVTDDARYLNANLAVHPYRHWPR